MTVCGVDGCPAGWLAVIWDGGGNTEVLLCRTFKDVLDTPTDFIAVDMPIGLPEIAGRNGRICETLARSRLGDRQSSVFAVPSRAAVLEQDYRRACAVNLQHSEPPKKVSKQCFNLFPKIREIDALISPELQTRVYEVHPELAFWALNAGQPLPLAKKIKSRPNPEGLELRRELLNEAGFPIEELDDPGFPRSKVGPDDILDACACAWSAMRISRGEHITLPPEPVHDGRGLRMEINA
ncbi:MAG: DUF429 domain-containing protein [Pseudomonadota bacterium]